MYFTVKRGWQVGVFQTEEEAKKSIEGFNGGYYEVFSTKKEAEASLSTRSFQKLKINFDKASRELKFREFKSRLELRNHEHYIYKTSMESSLDWISNYQEIVNASNIAEMHNIFSIVGDRGAGKSSFMATLNDSLSLSIHKDEHKSGQEDIFTLPIIDPNIFDNTISLIEFLISMLKSEVDKIKIQNERNNSNGNFFYDQSKTFLYQKFNNEIRVMIEILKSMRIDKSEFAGSKSGPEILENINAKTHFRNQIAELVDTFLSIVNSVNGEKNYTQISILLDDLDLVKNEDVYRTLQECFKFLLYQPNMIIFISYREKQLTNSVLDHLIDQNKNLINQSLISIEELKEQAANFLEKGLPRQKRVYLLITKNTTIYSILYPFVEKENLLNIEYLKQIYVEDFLQDEVMKQTRLSIEPIDGAELTHYVFPKSLRSVIQYLELIHDFEDYQTGILKDDNELSLSKLRKNIKKYKYFFISLVQDSLPENYFTVIDEFFKIDNYYKNNFICKELLNDIKASKDSRIEKLLNKEVYNVSLGDVFESMHYYKNRYKNEMANYYIYSLKLAYSIEMLLTLTKSLMIYDKIVNKKSNAFGSVLELSKEEVQHNISLIQLDKYLDLNRGKVMPDDFYYNQYIPLKSKDTNLGLFLESLFRYPKNSEITPLYQKYLMYSDITAFGDIRKVNEDSKDFTQKTFVAQFRENYLKSNFVGTNFYNIDLYASLSDVIYILSSFEKLLSRESNYYIFYSMFDIDLFFRKNYSRQSSLNADLMNYSIRRVNDIFTNTLQTPIEKLNRLNFSFPLFEVNYNRNNANYEPLIPIELMEWIESIDPIIRSNADSQPHENLEIEEINDSTREYFTDFINHYRDIDSIPAYKVKEFLRKYYSVHSEWPSIENLDRDRLESLIVSGNRKQISANDRKMLELIMEECL